jgi:hypothetical protein
MTEMSHENGTIIDVADAEIIKQNQPTSEERLTRARLL